MALISKYDNQTVFDILLIHSGAISGLFDFLESNGLTELNIPEGQYIAPTVLRKDVVDFLAAKNITAAVATSGGIAYGAPTVITLNGSPFGSFLPGTTTNIILQDQDDNPVVPLSVLDNVITVQNTATADWVRPASWPVRPEPLQEGVYFLIEHFPNTIQHLFWNATINTNIYIDGVLLTSATASTPTYIEINSNDYGVDYNGRLFSWIYCDILGTNPSIDFANNDYATNSSRIRFINVKEQLINQNVAMWNELDAGYSYGIKKFCINTWFKENIIIGNAQGLFMNTDHQSVENFPVLRSTSGVAFRDCNMSGMPTTIDFSLVTDASYTFYGGGNRVASCLKLTGFGSVLYAQYLCLYNADIISMDIDDCSSLLSFQVSFAACTKLQYLRLYGLKVSFDISYCFAFNRISLLELIETLADMTGFTSPTINLIEVPDNDHASVVNALIAKNWTIIS